MRAIFKTIGNSFGSHQRRRRSISYRCPVCKNEEVHFDPLPRYYFEQLRKHGYIHSIYQKETLHIKQYSCSHCHCTDRDRLYALYFEKKFATGNDRLLKILDIAPSAALSSYLKGIQNVQVRTADLTMPHADDKVDITNMPVYKDESFDIFICSHVLEHVEDDLAAMRELHRVLVKGGWGIAMVPIDLSLKEVYENASILDAAGRWKHFGQHDHLRMYSKDGFIQRLESVGFKVNQYNISYFGEEEFARHGIHPRSVLYIVTK